MEHSPLENFWNVEVSKFSFSLAGKENIRAFEVSMADLWVMKCFQSQYHLRNDIDEVLFVKTSAFLEVLGDPLRKISSISVFHDKA